MVIIALALFGLALGSFVNALVYRLHVQSVKSPVASRQSRGNKKLATSDQQQKTLQLSIINGRSQCVHCGHVLFARDLVPVLSWLSLGGQCRYCKKPISWQYPAVELTAAILFVASYIFWPEPFDSQQITAFGVWLLMITGLVSLVVYDIHWMLLPNKIIFPLIYLATLGVLIESAITYNLEPITSAALGAAVGGGLFYLLFQVSKGKWIGGGDVKLGFLLGIALGSGSLAFMMIFLASLLGVIFSLPLLLTGKVKRSTRIPFGPFLIAGAFISQLFGQGLLDWYIQAVIG